MEFCCLYRDEIRALERIFKGASAGYTYRYDFIRTSASFLRLASVEQLSEKIEIALLSFSLYYRIRVRSGLIFYCYSTHCHSEWLPLDRF